MEYQKILIAIKYNECDNNNTYDKEKLKSELNEAKSKDLKFSETMKIEVKRFNSRYPGNGIDIINRYLVILQWISELEQKYFVLFD